MNRIYKIHKDTLQYGSLHFTTETNIALQIKKDLQDSGLALTDLQSNRIVVDFRSEGQCNSSAAEFIDFLIALPVKDLLVIFNTVIDVQSLPYQAVCLPTWLTGSDSWLPLLQSIPYNSFIDRKFLCLMRRPNSSRARIARWLLDNDINVRFSFGSMVSSMWMGEYRPLFPDQVLPITIDGIIDRNNNNIEHVQTNPVFHSCLFNIVVETSSQTAPSHPRTPRGWYSIFITEKTFKSFGLRQIPIWFAVPGLVTEVRKLGFDMFDDIIDHSYDLVDDEDKRFTQVFDQIKKLNSELDLSQCQQLRNSMLNRFNNNFMLLSHYASIRDLQFQNIIKEFIQQ